MDAPEALARAVCDLIKVGVLIALVCLGIILGGFRDQPTQFKEVAAFTGCHLFRALKRPFLGFLRFALATLPGSHFTLAFGPSGFPFHRFFYASSYCFQQPFPLPLLLSFINSLFYSLCLMLFVSFINKPFHSLFLSLFLSLVISLLL